MIVSFAIVSGCALPVRWGGEALEGTVRAADTDQPVSGALVIAYYSSVYIGGEAKYTQGHALTDEEGYFRIDANPAMAYGTIGERPTLLYAHPEYTIGWTIFRERADSYSARPHLLPIRDRSMLDDARSACDELPSDACLELLEYVTGQ